MLDYNRKRRRSVIREIILTSSRQHLLLERIKPKMGRKSREKKERRLNRVPANQSDRSFWNGQIVRSISLKINAEGKNEIIDSFDRSGYKPSDPGGIPTELRELLRIDISNREHIGIFESFVGGNEDIENYVDDQVLGSWLCKETNNLMSDIIHIAHAEDDPENEEARYLQFISGPPANLILSVSVDRRLKQLWQPLNFETLQNRDRGVWVSRESSDTAQGVPDLFDALGFEYRLKMAGRRSSLTDQSGFAKEVDNKFSTEILKVLTINKQSVGTSPYWELIDHYFLFEVSVAPYDRLPSQVHPTHKNRGWQDKNGKVVSPHTKRNPRRRLKSRDLLSQKLYVVYLARDYEGVVRYIGEGEPSRPDHVNSGTSHVYNLNREHFAGRQMTVELFDRNLTKSEALTIEKLLLHKYRGCGLWNTKDYEA